MSAISLTVDGLRVEVPAGSTILDAARAAGIAVPTLCHLTGHPHQSACGACTVEADAGRLVPSCSCPAEDELAVLTSSPAALIARKAALDLLLSEHSGDCRAPCSRACPAGLDVMNAVRLTEAGNAQGALAAGMETLPFPGLMAVACAGYCERVCRRAGIDTAIDIRGMHAAQARAATPVERAAMITAASPAPAAIAAGAITTAPAAQAPTGAPVFIKGAGPAALSAAFFIRRAGRPVTVLGDPMEALRVTPYHAADIAGALEREVEILRLSGCAFRGGSDAAATPDQTPALLELDDDPDEWRIPAKAVARGRRAALALLHGAGPADAPHAKHPFESIVSNVQKEELHRLDAGLRRESGGQRCLACGCSKADDCRLRDAADAAGADRTRFPGRRIPMDRKRFPMGRAALVFEPGKCVRCAKCVRLSARTPFPLSFMARGFGIEVGGFWRYCRPECAQVFLPIAAACPTGCLSWEEGNG